jgi:hypothetical protein
MHDPIRTLDFSTIPLYPFRPTMRLENETCFATHLSLSSVWSIPRFESQPFCPAANNRDTRASSPRRPDLLVELFITPSIGRASPIVEHARSCSPRLYEIISAPFFLPIRLLLVGDLTSPPRTTRGNAH